MRSLLIIVFTLFSICSFAQIEEFYNNKGQLLVDTNYTLTDVENIPYFGGYGKELIYLIITRLDIPPVIVDNGINSIVFIEFELMSKEEDNKQFNILNIKFIPENKGWLQNSFLDEIKIDMSKMFSRFQKEYISKLPYKFYIPIQFISIGGDEHKVEKYYNNGIIIYKTTILNSMLIIKN